MFDFRYFPLLFLVNLHIASAIFCPDIEPVQYADMKTSMTPPYRNGTIANFKCDIGYKGVGKPRMVCLESGKWSSPSPYCTAYKCKRDLSKVKKGRKCRKRCKKDSDCKGGFNICRCDDWCGKSCYNPDADCPKLSEPTNGYILASGISYGNTVTYGCDEGFLLTGPSTRRCRSDKKWTGFAPSCVPFSACGFPGKESQQKLTSKVVEGTEAKQGAWPWQTFFFYNINHSVDQMYNIKSGFGGGTIINEEWVLSAAHVFDQFYPLKKTKNWKDGFLLAVGMTAFPSSGHEIAEHINIFEPNQVYSHPSFNIKSYDYDVALIRIGARLIRGGNSKFVVDLNVPAGKFIFSRYIRPVCLPCMKGGPLSPVDLLQDYDKEECNIGGNNVLAQIAPSDTPVIVTGFGHKRYLGDSPSHLQEGLLKIVEDIKCSDSIKNIQRHVADARFTRRMFCAASADENLNVDSCQGDSGGPVVIRMKLNKNIKYWMQIGIVSFGFKCGGDYPGFYISVPSVISWIWKVLDDNKMVERCPPPSSPINGKVKVDSFELDSVATYSCDSGYRLNGADKGHCNNKGSWGEVPICDVDIQCSFEDPLRPICGYSNPGVMKWIREIVQENRDALPSSVLKYEGGRDSAILKSPVIPDSKPHCIQFYFKSTDGLQSVNDLTVEINGAIIKAAAPEAVTVPRNRWIGLQATMETEKTSFQYEIIAKGNTVILLDDITVVKEKCKSPCKSLNRCKNEAVCVDEIKTSYCICKRGFTGKYCEKEITCQIPLISNGRANKQHSLKLDAKVYFDCKSGYQLRGPSFATCISAGTLSELPACIGVIEYDGECPSGFQSHQLMCYRIFENAQTYNEAKETCAKYGANLATIQSSSTDQFIYENSPYSPLHYYLWIGLRLIGFKRKWESGFQYHGIPGVKVNQLNSRQNDCAAYEYNWGRGKLWHVISQSCTEQRKFICETWSFSTKSYNVVVSNERSDVYRPVNGFLTASGRQAYKRVDQHETMYLYHSYHADSQIEGWFIGHYDIRQSKPGYWYYVSQSNAIYPDQIQSGWKRRRNWQARITITETDPWSEWSAWSSCDVTCGEGMQIRNRRCERDHDFLQCKGKPTQERSCTNPVCGDGDFAFNFTYESDTFFFFSDALSWVEARRKCMNNYMELALIEKRELADMLSSKIRSSYTNRNVVHTHWVNGRVHGGIWKNTGGTNLVLWDSGVGRRMWAGGEPNGWESNNDCIALNPLGGFNDHPCWVQRKFICQRATLRNPCLRKPCRGKRICNKIQGGYECLCPFGTVEPSCNEPEPTLPPNTRDWGPCTSDPCFGRAKCIPDNSQRRGFVCFCKPGWFGELCDQDSAGDGDGVASSKPTTIPPSPSSPCSRNPCNDREICVVSSEDESGYRCDCRDGYKGRNCEISVTASPGSAKSTKSPIENPCKPDPCNGGGRCAGDADDADGFVCVCNIGITGKYCETRRECRLEEIPQHVEMYHVGNGIKYKSAESILDGSVFQLRCVADGEVVVGEEKISCNKAQWSRTTNIFCVDMKLCKLETIDTDIFDVFYNDVNPVRSFPVRLESGYSVILKCQKDNNKRLTFVLGCHEGKWTSSVPNKCVEATCPDVQAPTHGAIIVDPAEHKPPFRVGTRISFKCDPFYHRTGDSYITCREDGTWSSQPSKCEESGCLLFPSLDLNGGVFVRKHRKKEEISAKPGDKYELACEKNKKIRKTITCKGKDKWKPALDSFSCD